MGETRWVTAKSYAKEEGVTLPTARRRLRKIAIQIDNNLVINGGPTCYHRENRYLITSRTRPAQTQKEES